MQAEIVLESVYQQSLVGLRSDSSGIYREMLGIGSTLGYLAASCMNTEHLNRDCGESQRVFGTDWISCGRWGLDLSSQTNIASLVQEVVRTV